jgi:hypothetical protein
MLGTSAAPHPTTPPVPVRPEPLVVDVDDGFHWSDAGIGAVAGFGGALVLSGSLALAGHRRRGGTRPPARFEERSGK